MVNVLEHCVQHNIDRATDTLGSRRPPRGGSRSRGRLLVVSWELVLLRVVNTDSELVVDELLVSCRISSTSPTLVKPRSTFGGYIS